MKTVRIRVIKETNLNNTCLYFVKIQTTFLWIFTYWSTMTSVREGSYQRKEWNMLTDTISYIEKYYIPFVKTKYKKTEIIIDKSYTI